MALQTHGIPTLVQARQYSVNRAGVEGIRQTLYDYNLYPTAGVQQIVGFSQQQGQGVTSALGAVVGSAKTIADTNMTLSGQIPAGQGFLILSIEVPFYPGLSAAANTFTPAVPSTFAAVAAAAVAGQVNDVKTFYESGSVRLFIGSKTYLEEAPILRFPPKAYFEMSAALATNSATTSEVAAVELHASGRPYMVEPAVLLENNQNFNVQLNFPAAVATPSGFNARVGIILDGYLYRNSQ